MADRPNTWKTAKNRFSAIFHVKKLSKIWNFFVLFFPTSIQSLIININGSIKCKGENELYLYSLQQFLRLRDQKLEQFWPIYKVDIRPNIRPNIRRNLAEYSVSADTNFRPIGRSLTQYYVRIINVLIHPILYICINYVNYRPNIRYRPIPILGLSVVH